MNIEVKGHSGCRIEIVQEGREVFVCKSTGDPEYFERLVLQAGKQKAAHLFNSPHIRVPEVYGISHTDGITAVKMEYVYSKNFVEFFQQAGFEQIKYLIGSLERFIDYEVSRCQLTTVSASVFREKFEDVRSKVQNPSTETMDILERSQVVFDRMGDIRIPVGLCHGDLTFSNILFNGNNYYLIDFLDSFIETPLQDIAKIRQDTCYKWSQMMYTKPYDRIRMKIICDRMDDELDTCFSMKYDWYRQHYRVMQLMNILRILPYAKEPGIVDYLNEILGGLVDE